MTVGDDRLPVGLLHPLLGSERLRHGPRGTGAGGGGPGAAARDRAGGCGAAGRGRGAPAHRTRAPRRDRALGLGDDRAGGRGAAAVAPRAGARAAGPRGRRVDGTGGADRDAPARRAAPRAWDDARVRAAAVAADARHPDRDGARGRSRGRSRRAGRGARAPAGRRPLRLPARPGGADEHAQVRRARRRPGSRCGGATTSSSSRWRTTASSEAASNGAGHGLAGMRERVALCGGTLETGPRDGGGFVVRCHLPLESPA